MMLESSTAGLLTRTAFMHYDDQGHDALRHNAILKGLKLDSICVGERGVHWPPGHVEPLTLFAIPAVCLPYYPLI